MATAVYTILPSLSEARRIARALAKARCPVAGRIEAVGAPGGQGPGGAVRLVVRCDPETLAEVERLIREHHIYADPSIWTETVEPDAAPRPEEPRRMAAQLVVGRPPRYCTPTRWKARTR